MATYLPAVCYSPTTVVLIDDDRKFLNSIEGLLDGNQACFQFFDNPKKTLDFLINKKSDPFTKRCVLSPEEEQLDHLTLDIDVRAIHQESRNPQRFAEISVVVSDYAMPAMNGLELCEQLKDKPYKKLLLTCEADEKLAVKAFNHGLIDQFVRKDAPNFEVTINQAIHDLQKHYFHDLSRTIVNTLVADAMQPATFFTDPTFMQHFDEIAKPVQMSEFYLMDSSGSFMFLDINGNPKWFAVKNEAEMQAFAEYARDADEKNPEVIKLLEERRVVPYFHTDEDLQTGAEDWLPYLHPAQKISGKDAYYYSLITNPKAYNAGNVLSFAEYCKKKF